MRRTARFARALHYADSLAIVVVVAVVAVVVVVVDLVVVVIISRMKK